MSEERVVFASLADAIAALHATSAPLVLTRFEPVAAERLVIAANEAAAADPDNPAPGEYPDVKRDRHITADIELDYLYRQLVERGHARQVLSMAGRLRELTITRVYIGDDPHVYGFVSPKTLDPPPTD